MKIYSEPFIELLALSPMDIIQSSGGNDPYESEDDGWSRKGALPGLKI